MTNTLRQGRSPETLQLRIALPALLTVALFVGAMHFYFLPAFEQGFMNQKRESCRRLTEAAYTILSSYGAMEQTGRMTGAEAREAARRQLRTMRYGPENKDYFWISDYDGRVVMHPYRPDLEHRDLSDFHDHEGTLVFALFADIVRNRGEGFAEYYWQWKDKPGGERLKISYVKGYAPWRWIVGTGVYVDDVHSELNSVRRDMTLASLGILAAALAFAGYIIFQARAAGRERQDIWQHRESLIRALGEQERLYRSLVDNITTGVALINPDKEIAALNRQMLQWFPDLDATGKPACHQLLAPGSLPCEVCAVQLTFEDGQSHEKTALLAVRGELRHFRVVASPVKNVTGEVTAAIEMFDDVTDRLLAEQKIREAEQRYRGIFENAVEGLFQTTPEGRFLTANPAMARMLGFDSAEELMDSVTDIGREIYLTTEARERSMAALDENSSLSDYEVMVRRKDGETIWISGNVRIHRDEEGNPVRFEGSAVDITKRRAAELELARQRAYFQQLFESSPLAIMLVDPDGLILDVNPGFTAMFGYESAQVKGRRGRSLLVPEKLISEGEAFHRTIFMGRSIHKESVRRHADGKHVPVSIVGYPLRFGEQIAGAYYIYQDITERKSFERQLSHQAFHDSLTSLPNRSLYMERLAHALERLKRRDDYHFAAMMIDLNRFKRINDTHGHQVGDQLLMTIALRLLSCIRTVDTVARLGGDEFAVLLEEFESPREVIQVADRITRMLDEPVLLEGQELHTSASIGIVLDTRGYESADDILRDADIAMYQSKERNRPRLVFNRRMHTQAAELGRMEAEMRRALDEGQFVLHYQPIYSAMNSEIQGFEALVRWNHPDKGLLGPLEFIPLAEETGLIVPLGRWVLREACRQMAAWRSGATCSDEVSVSVNISARQFAQSDLVEFIRSTLEEEGLSPCFLKLEITESVLMEDADGASAKLRRLKELGIKLMIDDFGTGYSSLSYLQRFPVDYLKIDRSFISGGRNELENREIVGTIIALARNLGLRVVAEGVEEMGQFEMLRDMNCDDVQGFMFSRPVESAKAADLLEEYISTIRAGAVVEKDTDAAPEEDNESDKE
jgi:Amt family ammonium transporter